MYVRPSVCPYVTFWPGVGGRESLGGGSEDLLGRSGGPRGGGRGLFEDHSGGSGGRSKIPHRGVQGPFAVGGGSHFCDLSRVFASFGNNFPNNISLPVWMLQCAILACVYLAFQRLLQLLLLQSPCLLFLSRDYDYAIARWNASFFDHNVYITDCLQLQLK